MRIEKIRHTLHLSFLIILLLSSFPCYASIDHTTQKAASFGIISVKGPKGRAFVKFGNNKKRISLSKWGLDPSLEYLHGMYYTAVTTRALKAKSADDKKAPVNVKKGTQVIILYYPTPNGKTVCRLRNKRSVFISGKDLKTTGYIYNSSRAYKDAQIEEWIERKRITSGSDYIFFVSKYNQRGWILKREGNKWKCRYVLSVSTGVYTNKGKPNDCYPLNSCSINTHYTNMAGFGNGISYASSTGGNQIHLTGKVKEPTTHGCIAIKSKDYNFVYYYLPYDTRVVLF